jgi:hypothetical protein
MSFPREGSMIGKGRPGGPGGNKVPSGTGGDPIRKARPNTGQGAPQSTATKGSDRDAIRKARPKSSGSGQSTAHK